MSESPPSCRHCGAPLTLTLVDLGQMPVANSYVPLHLAAHADPLYPLHARVCTRCWLVQIEDVVPPAKIFCDTYPYFSSFSDVWLAHCRSYAEVMTRRLRLGSASLVIEIASNDGCLLQYFADAGIPVLGIEPSRSVACIASNKGIPTLVEFFDQRLRRLCRTGEPGTRRPACFPA